MADLTRYVRKLTYLIELGEELVGVGSVEVVPEVSLVEQGVLGQVCLLVASSLLLFSVNELLERADLLGGVSGLTTTLHTLDVLEGVLGIEQALVDGTSLVSKTHHKDLS